MMRQRTTLAACLALLLPAALGAAARADDDFPSELVDFVAYQGNPVFAGTGQDTWDRRIRERGCILKEGDAWHLWYTGYNDKRGDAHHTEALYLGYATSPDGLKWTRYGDKPIFDKVWTEDMEVFKLGDLYYMFAEGRGDIAHWLTSKDRIHWEERGSLDIRYSNGKPLSPGPYGTPFAWVEDGKWRLLYERDDKGIWLAASPDGKVWTNVQDAPVIPMGPEPYDKHALALNQVVKYHGKYYGYYHGNADPQWKGPWTTSVAMSTDLVHWKKYAKNPIIATDHSSAILVHDGRQYRLYTMHPDVRAWFPRQPAAEQAGLILHHGKIVTVDAAFRVAEAMAVRGDRILAVGGNEEILKLAGPNARQIDLKGKAVLPGLTDSHAHPPAASVFEFDHGVPQMETIADVLAYVRSRAAALGAGQWIRVQQVFITRLRDQRFPTRQELDDAAPGNPVVFRTGPDASLNSLALRLSGIDKKFRLPEGQLGIVDRDPATGEPTGILRNCARFIKYQSPEKGPTARDRYDCLKKLLAAYNEAGITSVIDRDTDDGAIGVYQQLKDRGELTCRTFLTYHVESQGPWAEIEAGVRRAAAHPLHRYDNMLWLRGLKIYLDGGMLTGSAYMRQPWGASKIYSISDPQYRGVLFVEPDRLYRIARLTLENDLQLTAHSVGDGAVHAMIDAYERVDRDFPVRDKRPCISHCNFMSLEAIEKMKRLGIVADLQPAWLYLDGVTLLKQFGQDRLRYFQPYRTLFEQGVTVGGGSDHMQKLGSLRSLNPYNPFLGIWIALRRLPRWTDQALHPEQVITRQQAIRLYTVNCAYLTFEEKEKGSLEKGKLADFIVLDRDILACAVDEVKDIAVEETWLGGKQVYCAKKPDHISWCSVRAMISSCSSSARSQK